MHAHTGNVDIEGNRAVWMSSWNRPIIMGVYCLFIVVPCKNTKLSRFIEFTEYATFNPSQNTTLEVATKECDRENFPIKTCDSCKELFMSSGIIDAVKKEAWNMLHSSQYDMATIVSIYTLVKKLLHSPVKGTRAFSNHVQAQSLASMLCIKFFLLNFKWAGRQCMGSICFCS